MNKWRTEVLFTDEKICFEVAGLKVKDTEISLGYIIPGLTKRHPGQRCPATIKKDIPS